MIKLEDLHLLLPQIVLVVAAIIAMLSIAVKRSPSFIHKFTLLALVVAFASMHYIGPESRQLTSLFIIDGFSLFFTGLILIAVFFVALISFPYFRKRNIEKEEYYVLLLLSTLGAITMVISNNFISFFLSLELLSVSLYALIAYLKHETSGIEAGIKYLVLAAVSSAILLFGIALIYAQTGALELDQIADSLAGGSYKDVVFATGMALVIAGIGFKMALVPFHLWTPDIYAGAPAPVSAYVATVSKGSVFAFLLRLFTELNGSAHDAVWIVFAVIAIGSMLIGNWLALRQQNIKRLLAYSSIGHLGYLIVALLAASTAGMHAAVFYLVTYFISMLAAFGIISYVSGKSKEAFKLEAYRGLFWQRPWLAVLLTAVMLSLAGIPITAGFIGKFYLLLSGVGSGLWLLTIVLVTSSSIGLFYYLRVVVTMFSRKEGGYKMEADSASVSAGIALAVLFVLLLWFGLLPNGLMHYIHQLVGVIQMQ